jgi:spore maturation protein SpmA
MKNTFNRDGFYEELYTILNNSASILLVKIMEAMLAANFNRSRASVKEYMADIIAMCTARNVPTTKVSRRRLVTFFRGFGTLEDTLKP